MQVRFGAIVRTGFNSGDAFGSKGSQSVKQIQGPLTVSNEKTPGVQTYPPVLLEQQVMEPMYDQVALGVLVHGHLESHVREDGVAIHPPYPLHVRVVEHHLAQQRQLGPERAHLLLERGHVVEKLQAMEARVVDAVLQKLEVVEVAQRVGARPWLRTGNEERLGLPSNGLVVAGIAVVPLRALCIPVGDLGAQRVGRAGVPLGLLNELAGGGGVRHGLVHLRQHSRALRPDNLLAQVRNMGRLAPEQAVRAHRPAQHQQRDEPAEDGGLERA